MPNSKLRIAILRNKRKFELDKFEEKLSQLINEKPLKYYNFEKSLDIYDQVCNCMTVENDVATGRVSLDFFKSSLERFLKKIDNEKVILFLFNFECIGGIEFKLHDFLKYGADLLSFDGGNIFAVSEDLISGMILDFDDNSRPEDWGYEAFIWGSWKDKYGSLLRSAFIKA